MPGVQKPHCSALRRWNASCRSAMAPESEMPSMVSTSAPSHCTASIEAAAHHRAVDPHRAGAADALFAADMAAGQAEVVAQEIDQRLAGLDALAHVLAVDAQICRKSVLMKGTEQRRVATYPDSIAADRVLPRRHPRRSRARCRWRGAAASCEASSVRKPAWAVSVTLSMPRQRMIGFERLGMEHVEAGVADAAAAQARRSTPPRRPSAPRAVLTRITPGFMRATCAAPRNPRVSSLSARFSVITSAPRQQLIERTPAARRARRCGSRRSPPCRGRGRCASPRGRCRRDR